MLIYQYIMVELVRSLMYNQRHDTTDVSEKLSILTVFGSVQDTYPRQRFHRSVR